METEITIKKKVEISKEDFEKYVKVQMSGVTNMFDISVVMAYSGLSREKVLAIMKNYSEIKQAYNRSENEHK